MPSGKVLTTPLPVSVFRPGWVMLKNGTIGITGLMQGCPNGVQTLLGNRISINGNLIPTSQMCNQQTGFRAVEVEVGQAPEMVKKAV
ncbi:hypothetical protein BZL69_30665, partial [Escherichia coli]